MKLTFETYTSKDGKSPGLKTTYDSIEYTQEEKESLCLEILKHLGNSLFPNMSDERMKFENAVWYYEKKKALGKPNP